MAREIRCVFTVQQPPSPATVERMARFLADALAKRENLTVTGTFRALPPEEVGRRPLVNPAALAGQREASCVHTN